MKDKVCGADYSSAWGLEKSYILGPWTDEIICFVDRTADSDPPPRYYFTKDRLNSTRELINASATVMTTYDYDLWGAPTESHLSDNISTRYRAGGRAWSAVTGLRAARGGWIDPGPGRRLRSAVEAVPRASVRAVVGHWYRVWPVGLTKHDEEDCIHYCQFTREDCFRACSRRMAGQCTNSWTLGLCARCCQCWGKRCVAGCEGDERAHGPNGETLIFFGALGWGDNARSVEECGDWACRKDGKNFRPADWMGDEYDDSRVDARNVCATFPYIDPGLETGRSTRRCLAKPQSLSASLGATRAAHHTTR